MLIYLLLYSASAHSTWGMLQIRLLWTFLFHPTSFSKHMYVFLLTRYLEMELLNHMEYVNVKTIFQSPVNKRPRHVTASPQLGNFCLFHFIHSGGCHCGFRLYFLDDWQSWAHRSSTSSWLVCRSQDQTKSVDSGPVPKKGPTRGHESSGIFHLGSSQKHSRDRELASSPHRLQEAIQFVVSYV